MGGADDDLMKAKGWTLGKELGSGHFAKVRLATRDSDGMQAALKIIKKPKELKKQVTVENEKKILLSVDHPHIVKCYDSVETDDKMYLMLELCPGGELFDRIVDMGHFTEAQAAEVTFKLISALKYMHDQGVAHRDLKPENMLMTSKDADAEVKITDFGLSKFFDENSSLMKTPCGTPGYIAPEVLHMKGYNKLCDIWSLGVIVYILLCGFPPFYADNDAQLFEKIKKGRYEFLKPYWDPVSETAKDFIRAMLIVDPAKRPDCDALLQHPWIKAKAEAAAAAGKLNTVSELGASNKKMVQLKKLFQSAHFSTELLESARGK